MAEARVTLKPWACGASQLSTARAKRGGFKLKTSEVASLIVV
jgi:hypothetical protein